MTKRSFIIAILMAIAIVSYSSNANAAPNTTDIISTGRISYDNETPDDLSDDIILFDADDLKALERKINILKDSL